MQAPPMLALGDGNLTSNLTVLGHAACDCWMHGRLERAPNCPAPGLMTAC